MSNARRIANISPRVHAICGSSRLVAADASGTETLIGVINSITDDDDIVLASNATTSLANTFMFVKKNSTIEGDRLKGHFMDTELTKRTKDKIHIFASNANVNKSELSNK